MTLNIKIQKGGLEIEARNMSDGWTGGSGMSYIATCILFCKQEKANETAQSDL